MRSLQLACIITGIITGTVAITALTLLGWPLLFVLLAIASVLAGAAAVWIHCEELRRWERHCAEAEGLFW